MSATLASLRIRHLALVEDLLWEPPAGFVAITGETGAGKSIILGAVKLLLGERAEKSLVRTGADACTVEGVFDLPADSPVHALLDGGGVEPCEDGRLIVRRTVPVQGTGKQFVNGSPCTLSLLREIGVRLVDLHGPHDHQSLFSRDEQILVLDAFAGAGERRAEFVAARREWLRLTAEKKRLTEDAGALAREIDLLSHQVREIEDAALSADEEDPLLARQKAGTNSHRLAASAAELAALTGDSEDSITGRLAELTRLAREMAKLDPAATRLHQAAEGLFESVQDFSRDLAHYADSLESDPTQLAAVEARLDVIQTLKRKYGATLADVIAFGEQAATRLAELRSREASEAGLDDAIAGAAKHMTATGKALGQARQTAAPKLAKLIRRHLADLGFAKSGFSVTFEQLDPPGPLGFEQVEFLFAPNPGEPELPLRAIASSGEISRVMLAVKTALTGEDRVPVLIFDEIDANVGGEIGARVGAKMRELSASHQVLCITHLPQVAAAAGSQFVVTKSEQAGRTVTTLTPADGSAREEEIARMLGGRAASALAHARELLRAP